VVTVPNGTSAAAWKISPQSASRSSCSAMSVLGQGRLLRHVCGNPRADACLSVALRAVPVLVPTSLAIEQRFNPNNSENHEDK